MPQVKDKTLKDGWYVNKAKDADGKPRALSLGAVVTIKPGGKKFLQASMVTQSRATHAAVLAALDNGTLALEGAPEPAPKPEPPPVEEPVVEKEPVVEEPVDQSLTRDDLKSMNKSSLIEMAEGMGLDTEGTKSELVDRILVAQE